ncbi:hypothetical protein ACR9E3_27915 [Actinomycetospora sp. C-140]
MSAGTEAELAAMRTRVRGQVERSRALIARVASTVALQEERARAVFDHSEQRLNRLARALPRTYGLPASPPPQTADDVFGAVLAAARAAFRGATAVSLTSVQVGSSGQRYFATVAASGDAERLDAVQYALREGPTVEAVALDHVGAIRAEDLASEDAACWPRFSAAACAFGVRSMLSISVPRTRQHVGPEIGWPVVGAITLYAPERGAFVEPEATGLVLGTWAGSVLSGGEPAEVYDAATHRPPRPTERPAGD